MRRISRAMFNPHTLVKLEHEEMNPFKLDNLGLNLFFVINIAFLAYKFNGIYDLVSIGGKDSFAEFNFFIAMVALLFIFRYVSNKLIAFFTNEQKIMSE